MRYNFYLTSDYGEIDDFRLSQRSPPFAVYTILQVFVSGVKKRISYDFI